MVVADNISAFRKTGIVPKDTSGGYHKPAIRNVDLFDKFHINYHEFAEGIKCAIQCGSGRSDHNEVDNEHHGRPKKFADLNRRLASHAMKTSVNTEERKHDNTHRTDQCRGHKADQRFF